MKEIKIEHLVYMLKQAKKSNQPQPIFFLGAGASRSGNIPLACEITEKILQDYSDSPHIKDLPIEKKSYANLMDCLLPDQRDELLKKYVDEAKINVTHIYLAQLLKEGFVDYILTVNFDNLMLRALALFNIFPATYDMAIINDFTTTTFKEKSVVYLHGQNHGVWLLNTPSEMEKVINTVPRIFDTIKNKRPWVFIGYSGDDPIFQHIKNLGRFNNGLYWVTYNDNNPNECVLKFLSDPNTNASIIKGYDSDSFMLKLNNELGLPQPNIVNKPFTALKNMLNEIVDIDEKDFYKDVKERIKISNDQIDAAIKQYENGEIILFNSESNEINLLKKDIINIVIKEDYSEEIISDIDSKVRNKSDKELNTFLAKLYLNWADYMIKSLKNDKNIMTSLMYLQPVVKFQKAIELYPDFPEAYNNWGNLLAYIAKNEKTDFNELFLQSFEKYQKAIEIDPNFVQAYHNWGISLDEYARKLDKSEAEKMYIFSFEKFQKAISLDPKKVETYFNWGLALYGLAKIKKGKDAITLFSKSIEKFKKTLDLKPDFYESFQEWGNALHELGLLNSGISSENLLNQSFEKYQKAIELKPDNYLSYHNWGSSLFKLSKLKKGIEAEELILKSCEKFKKVIELNSNNVDAYTPLGLNYMSLALMKNGVEKDNLLRQSYEHFQKTYELCGKCYNLACFFAYIGNEYEALKYLDLSLLGKEITVSFVKKDKDWVNFKNNNKFINLINKYQSI